MTVNTIDDLIQFLQTLPDEALEPLEDYLEQRREGIINPAQPRILGSSPGIWMSDDFDAELPDEFWNWDKL